MELVSSGMISRAPENYAEWLACFEILQKRPVDAQEAVFLQQGTCRDIEDTVSYFENQLIKTENVMIRNGIRRFQRELNTHQIFQDFDSVHQPFYSFAKQMKVCMFFVPLDFLSKRFREELASSVEQEITKVWSAMMHSIYLQCVDGNPFLEDQLRLIRRIRIFSDKS